MMKAIHKMSHESGLLCFLSSIGKKPLAKPLASTLKQSLSYSS